jgi:hypothetical protein
MCGQVLKLLTQHARAALTMSAHGGARALEIRLCCDGAVQVGAVFGEPACVG